MFGVVGRSPSMEELMIDSVKLQAFLVLLRTLRGQGHKTLVFSQSKLMLDIIQRVLAESGIGSYRIDGSVSGRERQTIIDNMNDPDSRTDVCLLTTRACGFGITLTGADRVIVFDPSWNPAEDRQAVDRAYRIGQKNKVVVYRMIMAGSIEEKMYEKQVFKDGLRVVSERGVSSKYFSSQETKELFTLDFHADCSCMRRLWNYDDEWKIVTCPDMPDADISGVLGYSKHDALYVTNISKQKKLIRPIVNSIISPTEKTVESNTIDDKEFSSQSHDLSGVVKKQYHQQRIDSVFMPSSKITSASASRDNSRVVKSARRCPVWPALAKPGATVVIDLTDDNNKSGSAERKAKSHDVESSYVQVLKGLESLQVEKREPSPKTNTNNSVLHVKSPVGGESLHHSEARYTPNDAENTNGTKAKATGLRKGCECRTGSSNFDVKTVSGNSSSGIDDDDDDHDADETCGRFIVSDSFVESEEDECLSDSEDDNCDDSKRSRRLVSNRTRLRKGRGSRTKVAVETEGDIASGGNDDDNMKDETCGGFIVPDSFVESEEDECLRDSEDDDDDDVKKSHRLVSNRTRLRKGGGPHIEASIFDVEAGENASSGIDDDNDDEVDDEEDETCGGFIVPDSFVESEEDECLRDSEDDDYDDDVKKSRRLVSNRTRLRKGGGPHIEASIFDVEAGENASSGIDDDDNDDEVDDEEDETCGGFIVPDSFVESEEDECLRDSEDDDYDDDVKKSRRLVSNRTRLRKGGGPHIEASIFDVEAGDNASSGIDDDNDDEVDDEEDKTCGGFIVPDSFVESEDDECLRDSEDDDYDDDSKKSHRLVGNRTRLRKSGGPHIKASIFDVEAGESTSSGIDDDDNDDEVDDEEDETCGGFIVPDSFVESEDDECLRDSEDDDYDDDSKKSHRLVSNRTRLRKSGGPHIKASIFDVEAGENASSGIDDDDNDDEVDDEEDETCGGFIVPDSFVESEDDECLRDSEDDYDDDVKKSRRLMSNRTPLRNGRGSRTKVAVETEGDIASGGNEDDNMEDETCGGFIVPDSFVESEEDECLRDSEDDDYDDDVKKSRRLVSNSTRLRKSGGPHIEASIFDVEAGENASSGIDDDDNDDEVDDEEDETCGGFIAPDSFVESEDDECLSDSEDDNCDDSKRSRRLVSNRTRLRKGRGSRTKVAVETEGDIASGGNEDDNMEDETCGGFIVPDSFVESEEDECLRDSEDDDYDDDVKKSHKLVSNSTRLRKGGGPHIEASTFNVETGESASSGIDDDDNDDEVDDEEDETCGGFIVPDSFVESEEDECLRDSEDDDYDDDVKKSRRLASNRTRLRKGGGPHIEASIFDVEAGDNASSGIDDDDDEVDDEEELNDMFLPVSFKDSRDCCEAEVGNMVNCQYDNASTCHEDETEKENIGSSIKNMGFDDEVDKAALSAFVRELKSFKVDSIPTLSLQRSYFENRKKCPELQKLVLRSRKELNALQIAEYNDNVDAAFQYELRSKLKAAMCRYMEAIAICDDDRNLHKKLFLLEKYLSSSNLKLISR